MNPNVERTEIQSIRDQIVALQIAEGFFQSRVLFALLKLRVFELIGENDETLEELAAKVGTRPETLARLLNAGVVLKLLETRNGTSYRASALSRAVLLASAGDAYIGNWIANLAFFDMALSKLDEAVLKSAPTVDTANHFGADQERTREFILAMHDYVALRGKELARYLDTTGCETLLDLGCGHGAYAYHLGMSNPGLRLFLLDSPGVLEVAKEILARYPVTNTINYVPADAVNDNIVGQYDLILISNTLHALGPVASRALIKRLYHSIKPGGSLVVQAQFLKDDRLGERWPVLMDLIQLCITSDGSNHTVPETRCWFEEAGFTDIEHCRMSVFNTNSFLRGYRKTADFQAGVRDINMDEI